MINLKNINLTEILPPSVTSDKDIEALLYAVDRQLQQITEEIINVVIIPRIDELPEPVVDYLAWQFHVDFYEPLGLDLDKKRALVKSSISWHRRKGTKSVVEDVIQLLYYETSSVEEWFEYGGEPYFFRVAIQAELIEREDIKHLISAAKALKNVRSWLEGLVIISEFPENNLYLGTRSSEEAVIEFNMKSIKDMELTSKLFGGNALLSDIEFREVPVRSIKKTKYEGMLYHANNMALIEIIEIPTLVREGSL